MADIYLVGCDLLFFSKAAAMALAAGGNASNCPLAGPFEKTAGCCAFVSLAKPEALAAIAGLKAAGASPVIAFGSHVDAARLDVARAAGADEAIANSQFEARVRQALGV
jgi:Zn-dependent alcohol dehydrogenase